MGPTRRDGRPAVIRHKDPGAMSPEERQAELGALQATGVRRHRLRQKELADGGDSERPCHRPVNALESPDDQEVA